VTDLIKQTSAEEATLLAMACIADALAEFGKQINVRELESRRQQKLTSV